MKRQKLKTIEDFIKYDAREIEDPKAKALALVVANLTVSKMALHRAETLLKAKGGI